MPKARYAIVVPAGVVAVALEAVGSGGHLDPRYGVRPGDRVRVVVPASPGEGFDVQVGGCPLRDGGAEVVFATDWADRWCYAAGGAGRAPSWGPVGAMVERHVHRGPGRVTIAWIHPDAMNSARLET